MPLEILVVKKGSNILPRTSSGMPGPLSAMVTQTLFPWMCASDADPNRPPLRKRVDGVDA